jgi:diaminohydroxyphosphoribosylaminopyrimidine deaminase/5-amino-6-(5-phosphoribosylamino)uracil reductase
MQDLTIADPGALPSRGPAEDEAWQIVRAAAKHAVRLSKSDVVSTFAPDDHAQLRPVARDHPAAVIAWRPRAGWETVLPATDPRVALIDLYLPICSATLARPVTVGHLGQSLDGFIATHAGESQWVTGHENILHLHRLRALCDAVIVGPGTVATDDPQLTTRLVSGPNPLRVVLDPARRLGEHHKVFNDASAETLYLCSRSLVGPDERRFGCAAVVGIDGSPEGLDLHAVMGMLRTRGCARVFVEGGGITVSMFLKANLLDRLHLAIAPLIIGDGRPAIRLPASEILGDCPRPRYRVFRMGGDVMFDCELGARESESVAGDGDPQPSVVRVI